MKASSWQPVLLCLFFVVFVSFSTAHGQPDDPLRNWRDTAHKKKIIEFVMAVTTAGSPDFVPTEYRIATFDMDGTILVEKPVSVNEAFVFDYLKTVGVGSPPLAQVQPYKALRTGDTAYINRNLVQVLTTAYMNYSQEDYKKRAVEFTTTHQHPRFNRPYADLFYAPMLELIRYLRSNQFRVFIVSGSSQTFIRSIVKEKTGIENSNLMGTQIDLTYHSGSRDASFSRNGQFRALGVAGPGKPLIIEYQIGEKPILAFGNTAGDQAMFDYTATNPRRHLVLCLNHDDGNREYTYANKVRYQPEWLRISMKTDFAIVFETE